MPDDSNPEVRPESGGDVFSRNAEAVRNRARAMERRGLQHLERGLQVSAIESLSEAIELYEGLGDLVRSRSAEQYMALAMYERGEVQQAVDIWERLLALGWDRPTTLNFLVRHYEALDDEEAVQRIYDHLARARLEQTGFFSEFERDGAPVSETPANAATRTSGARDTATLLVADNDPAVRSVLGRILEYQGYRILYAENGEEALEALFNGAPDLAFLDIYMPRLSGLDVLYRMRAEDIKIPVIVISGRPHATMVQDAKVLGARFASKPLNFDQIAEMVGELLAEVRR
jgi:CheY-like chemotaxis protein